jgi:uncharacterized protein (TIGR04255 family)
LREALIDLRLSGELPDSFNERVAGQHLEGYAPPVQMWRGRAKVILPVGAEAAPPSISDKANERYGWRYTTNESSRVVQLRRDGMTYSVLQGYTNWEEMKASAQMFWRQYCEWGEPTGVGRLAVRYINVLEVPLGADFDIYLTSGPRVPPELPQTISGFLQRVVITFSADGTTAIVNQALEPPKETTVPVVLDIDVFCDCQLRVDSPEIWVKLDSYREIKNRIFFSSVTEKALEPYQ